MKRIKALPSDSSHPGWNVGRFIEWTQGKETASLCLPSPIPGLLGKYWQDYTILQYFEQNDNLKLLRLVLCSRWMFSHLLQSHIEGVMSRLSLHLLLCSLTCIAKWIILRVSFKRTWTKGSTLMMVVICMWSWFGTLINLFDKYLLSAYYVLSTVLRVGDSEQNRHIPCTC